MALLKATIADLALSWARETDIDETELELTAASTIIYAIEVDNTANSAISYLKLWNTNTVTVGTTVPDMILEVPASGSLSVYFPEGLTFPTAVSIACVTSKLVAGATGPTNSAILEIAYT